MLRNFFSGIMFRMISLLFLHTGAILRYIFNHFTSRKRYSYHVSLSTPLCLTILVCLTMKHSTNGKANRMNATATHVHSSMLSNNIFLKH